MEPNKPKRWSPGAIQERFNKAGAVKNYERFYDKDGKVKPVTWWELLRLTTITFTAGVICLTGIGLILLILTWPLGFLLIGLSGWWAKTYLVRYMDHKTCINYVRDQKQQAIQAEQDNQTNLGAVTDMNEEELPWNI